jgi:hypothetical protein
MARYPRNAAFSVARIQRDRYRFVPTDKRDRIHDGRHI